MAMLWAWESPGRTKHSGRTTDPVTTSTGRGFRPGGGDNGCSEATYHPGTRLGVTAAPPPALAALPPPQRIYRS